MLGNLRRLFGVASDSTQDKRLEKRIVKLEAAQKEQRKSNGRHSRQIAGLADLLSSLYDAKAKPTGDSTTQERAWRGTHGMRYVIAHIGEDWKATRLPYWRVILPLTENIQSVCEFGCNIGANLRAIHHLEPNISLTGVEINPAACDVIRAAGIAEIHEGSIADIQLNQQFDLVYSRGVLIHLNPGDVQRTILNMAEHSSRYVLIYEIFSPEHHHLADYSQKVRGTDGVKTEGYQFWQDFPSLFKTTHPDWRLVRSGVGSKLDAKPKHGDIYWGLFTKSV